MPKARLCKMMKAGYDADWEADADSQLDILDCDVESAAQASSMPGPVDMMPPLRSARQLKARASEASSFADDEASQAEPAGAGRQRETQPSASQATTITHFSPDFVYVPDDEEDEVPLSQTSHPADDDVPPPLMQSIPLAPSSIPPLVNEIGNDGCIFGPNASDGVAVDGGFEMLVRIALRCINLSPRHM